MRSSYLRMQTYVSAAALLTFIPTLSLTTPSRLSAIGCSGISLAVRDTEGSLTCIPSKWDTLSIAWVWAWGSGTLEPDFQTTSVSVHATCSFSLVAHQDCLLIFFQSHLVCQYLVWQAVFNQANWDGVRRLQAAFFPSYVIYFTSLTWPSDLFLCPWDRDTEQSECLIALFYKLYEYFMYFGPACGFWSETQRKTVWKREHLLFSQSVCEREGEHLLDSAIPQCLFQVTFAVFLLMFYRMFSHIYGLRVTLWQPNMFVSPALEHKVNL